MSNEDYKQISFDSKRKKITIFVKNHFLQKIYYLQKVELKIDYYIMKNKLIQMEKLIQIIKKFKISIIKTYI